MWQELKNIYHLFVAILASIYYGFPARKLTIVGVTGTDGKTTTVSLIYHILKESGYKASMISTVGAIIGGKKYDVGFHVTNPSSFPLQRFLKKAAEEGEYLVLEVTSHGLDQNRVFGIPFAIGVLTNVTHEHLDYHKTYNNYVKTKMQLLESAKIAIVNRDDESYSKVSSKQLITFGMHENADVYPEQFSFKTNLIGKFNTYNILAAIAVCKELGVSDQAIKKAILTFTAPIGRQEIVYDKAFKVIIDFAHTPNAFSQVLPEIKKVTQNKLIHVFGAAGKRDASKRPLMGEKSSKYADTIIVTAEDPREESVEKICNEIVSGIKNADFNAENLHIIPGRKKAIRFAIGLAKKGDVVLLTGKGHEKSMNYGKREDPWDEYAVVAQAIKEVENSKL